MTDATLTGYDSTASTVSEWRAAVPVSNPQVIGCYGNGDFANEGVARAAFPHATVFTYDVHATMPACDALDIEKGDAVAADAPVWNRAWQRIAHHILPRPTDYSFAANVSTVITKLLDAGWKRDQFNIHSAHTQHGEHICGPGFCQYPQADGTQWDFSGPAGQNVDQNVFYEHFFKDPKPKFDPHYAWFDVKKRAIFGGRTEVEVVKEYDKWRATQSTTNHPHRARLAVLRAQLRLGYLRLSHMTDLAPFHRQWRKRELLDRSQGQRLV